jgi:hypothetical protein
MKITVNPKTTTKETPYPKLMICTDTHLILLMTTQNKGTVLRSKGFGMGQAGDYSSNWSPSLLEDYKGTITLENTHEA